MISYSKGSGRLHLILKRGRGLELAPGLAEDRGRDGGGPALTGRWSNQFGRQRVTKTQRAFRLQKAHLDKASHHL